MPDLATEVPSTQNGGVSTDLNFNNQVLANHPEVRQAFNGIHQLELTDFPFVVEFSLPDVAIHKKGTENYAPSLVGMGETINIWQWCDNGRCPA